MTDANAIPPLEEIIERWDEYPSLRVRFEDRPGRGETGWVKEIVPESLYVVANSTLTDRCGFHDVVTLTEAKADGFRLVSEVIRQAYELKAAFTYPASTPEETKASFERIRIASEKYGMWPEGMMPGFALVEFNDEAKFAAFCEEAGVTPMPPADEDPDAEEDEEDAQ